MDLFDVDEETYQLITLLAHNQHKICVFNARTKSLDEVDNFSFNGEYIQINVNQYNQS